MKKIFSSLLFSLLIFIGGGIFCYIFFDYINLLVKNEKNLPKKTVMFERNSVACLGRIEPKGKVLSISAPIGSRIKQLLVEEGEYVKIGHNLAYLMDYERSQAEVHYIQSKLEEAKKTLIAEKMYAQTLIHEADIQLQTTQAEYDILIANQQRQISLAKKDYTFQEQEYQRVKKNKESVSIQQQDQQQHLYNKSQEQLNLAIGELNHLKNQRNNKILLANSKLETARANLERVISATPIKSLEKQLTLMEHQRDLLVITAPRDGQILKIFTQSGESVSNSPILQMGDTQQLYVSAEVYETDITLVKVGQTAEIESHALPNKINGIVEKIGWIIAKNDVLDVDPSSRIDARVVEVKIRLENHIDIARLTNLQVKVKIHLTKH